MGVAHPSYPQSQTDQFYPSSQPASGFPYGRPPRLPLPIKEVQVTGSSIITPQDISSAIGRNDIDGLPSITSTLSSTTRDDEDVGDNEAFSETRAIVAPSVPTTITWNRPGEKVYVTGTFVQWNCKLKLHPGGHGGFAIKLQLKPGTYHLKFLVDGTMITSNDMPTTVDCTNNLVNYVEIVAPLHNAVNGSMPIPGPPNIQAHAHGTEESVAKPLKTRTEMRAPKPELEIPWTKETIQAPAASKPLSIFPTQASRAPSPAQLQPHQEQQKPPCQPLSRGTYTQQIPQFLLDLDGHSSAEDELFEHPSHVVNTLPQPLSLPLFRGKSILNDTTVHKDYTSVLSTPNHTLLNHLTTSSIKDGMLAISGTTRYKRKFLTTIIYRPTPDDR